MNLNEIIEITETDENKTVSSFMMQIAKKSKQRVLNESSKKKLVLMEVQTGSKFLESDIKRYSDIYGRKN